MTRLIVVRHAQSEGNFGPVFTGHTNVFLTPHGHLQAEETAHFLDAYPADAAISSDLIRVQQTARHTTDRRGMELLLDPGLREIYLGSWEGDSYPHLMENHPEEWNVWINDPINMIFTGGESVYDMCSRVRATFARIAEEQRGKNVLIFTHCTPIRTMLNLWRGEPVEALNQMYFPSNASVTVVRYEDDGTFTLELEAYDEHLKQAGLLHKNKEERR